jgi:5-oxoprolinase (ATP-hydrolysing) subunit A
MAARDRGLADAIARATASFDRSLILFGLPGSALLDAGREAGLRVAAEAFADRSYEPDGSLTSRRLPHAIIHEPDRVVERVLRMARDGSVIASDGSVVRLSAETVCVHGDTPGAADLVARLRTGLERAGVQVRPIGQ